MSTLTTIPESAPGPLAENQIESLIAQEFSDPDLWKADREILAGVTSYSGMAYPLEAGMRDTSRFVLIDSSKVWFAASYGARVAPDPEHPEDNGALLQLTSLETMVAIHERLSENVLTGEHAHTSVLVIPPEPEEGVTSPANNQVWLSTIAQGRWPIMATGERTENGEPIYNSHDYADFHTGNMLLMPREAQDLMTTGAQYELAWHAKYHAGEVAEEVLMLPGDDPFEDPYASGFRGNGSGHTSGINKIDNLSDAQEYFDILEYAMEGNSGTAQVEALIAYMHEQPETPTLILRELATKMIPLKRMIGDLLNYNTRHALGRNTTPEEVEAATLAFLRGTARVADKIHGRPATVSEEDIPVLSPVPVTPHQEDQMLAEAEGTGQRPSNPVPVTESSPLAPLPDAHARRLRRSGRSLLRHIIRW